MTVQPGSAQGRRAPYAPISALREFFQRIRDTAVPGRVDQKFLQKLNVASNNEWALLSALKFLGALDDHGAPTHSYRLLQTTDKFQDTLRHLVETAYRPLFEMGGAAMSREDLVNYFRLSSSPSQAKNAARFFLEVCELAGIRDGLGEPVRPSGPPPDEPPAPSDRSTGPEPRSAGPAYDLLLETKARLLEKLPAPRPEWTAVEYEAICARFLDMLRSLDGNL